MRRAMDKAEEYGGGGHDFTEIQTSIYINAPVEEVFEEFSDFEGFPRFMPNVREVSTAGEGRLRWEVAGPSGTITEWNAVVTELVPNQVVAWRNEPGSHVT